MRGKKGEGRREIREEEDDMVREAFGVAAIIAIVFGIITPAVFAQAPAPAPTSHG